MAVVQHPALSTSSVLSQAH